MLSPRFLGTTLALALSLGTAAPASPQAGNTNAPMCGRGLAQGGPGATTEGGSTQAFSAGNTVTLLSNMSLGALGASSISDCWGYTAPSGREYAIVCLSSGTAWVEITNPSTPVLVASKSGPGSGWRDAKVYQDHAYVVSEGGSGIQVYDMSNIDAGTVQYKGSVTAGGGSTSHNVAIDTDSGFLYRCGGSSQGLRFYDLNQSLSSPPFVGSWSGKYAHDAQIVTYTSGPAAGKQIAYVCTGSSQDLTVVDVTNKSSPQVISSVGYSKSGYSHQGWLGPNQQYFYLNDEFDEGNFGLATTTIVFDVSDPWNAFFVGKFDNGNPAIGHNGYVKGDLLYEANYTSGLRVFDLSVSPVNPPEVGWYDTYPGNPVQYDGLWSCFPFFPSGVVIGSDQQNGLYVWFNEELLDVTIAVAPPPFLFPSGQVLPVTITETSPGNLQAGTELLHYDVGAGWQTAPLANLGGGSYEAQFPGIPCGAEANYYFSAQSTNGFTWTDPAAGATGPYVALVATSSTTVFHDDFEQDLGWAAENAGATAGDFDRGVPVNDPNWAYDPLADADGSGQCWVTENALGNTDVDGGGVRLVSPSLDLSGSNPVVQYDYYLYLTDQGGVDYLRVKANDNAGSGWQTLVSYKTSGQTNWRRAYLLASDFAAAGVALTSNVSLRFIARDSVPESIVEAGLDGFYVLDMNCDSVVSYCTAGTTASGCQVNLSSAGTPSLSLPSGFTVTGANGEGSKDGIFFLGQNGQQANPWGNGSSFQCVVPPVQRTPTQSGVGANNTCDGNWSIDLNAWSAANPVKAPAAGIPTQVQFWFRDPANTSSQTTSLSDALSFMMAP